MSYRNASTLLHVPCVRYIDVIVNLFHLKKNCRHFECVCAYVRLTIVIRVPRAHAYMYTKKNIQKIFNKTPIL